MTESPHVCTQADVIGSLQGRVNLVIVLFAILVGVGLLSWSSGASRGDVKEVSQTTMKRYDALEARLRRVEAAIVKLDRLPSMEDKLDELILRMPREDGP